MDVRPGGEWNFIMHGPDGTDYQNQIVYREVVRPERLVYDHVTGPLFRATVTFEDGGDKTRVTMQMLFESAELRNQVAEEFGAVEGLNQTLDHLGEHVDEDARPRSSSSRANSTRRASWSSRRGPSRSA